MIFSILCRILLFARASGRTSWRANTAKACSIRPRRLECGSGSKCTKRRWVLTIAGTSRLLVENSERRNIELTELQLYKRDKTEFEKLRCHCLPAFALLATLRLAMKPWMRKIAVHIMKMKRNTPMAI